MKRPLPVVLILSVLAWTLQLPAGYAWAAADEPSAGAAKLVGKVVVMDGTKKMPVEGARVLAYHLATEGLFASDPTKSNAEYSIDGLPYGYFDLAVETSDGIYVGNQVVNITPSSKAAVVFTLTPLAASEASGSHQFPGTEMETSGHAQVFEKPRGKEFWRSPKGIAIIAGIGGVALLAIATGTGGETDSSPF